MRKPLLTPLSLIALSLALVACGGDSDEDQVTETIETSVKSSDPADCTELATQAFVEQTEFEQGEAAVKSCQESASETADDPDSVEISEVKVDGDRATAAVAFTGGTFDGQTLDLSLVDDGSWKLDSIDDLRDFDQEAFADAFEEVATKGEDPLTPEQASCVADNFRNGPTGVVEEALLSGDPQQLAPAFEGCDLG